MAFQRPFLISLKRADSQRWGFGITGGKEYGEPLRIQSVVEDSIAELCGLHAGDEVIQVGRVNVQDLAQSQVYELLARCGNKIEMFVIREDLLAPRKGKEPPVVKAVVHNPYNSPLSLYSTENVADTLARQTEVLTEGYVSPEEEEGPESLSFKEKSAVFQLLEEQAKQEGAQKNYSRGGHQSQAQIVVKPKSAPPPPPKPKQPVAEHLYNGYDTAQRNEAYQDHQYKTSSRVEHQTTQKVSNQYQYQQEQPIQYQQTSVYQTSSYQKSPGYQSPVVENSYSPGYQSPVANYQQKGYQQSYQQSNYQQTQSPHSPAVSVSRQQPGYQSPTTYQPLNQINYQQTQNQQNKERGYQQSYTTGYQSPVQQPQKQQSQQQVYQQQQQSQQQNWQQQQQHQTQQQNWQQQQAQQQNWQQQQQLAQQQNYQQQQQQQQQQKAQQSPTTVSKAEFKIGPPPPPRVSSSKPQQDPNNMAAVYKQQYEQHLQQQYSQQQMHMNNYDVGSPPKAHIIRENIFENNSTTGTPITYKAPPAPPQKPDWPPPPQSEHFRSPAPPSPTGMRVGSVWPPKRSAVTELPRTGFNPAAVREQGTGRRCVWPPQKSEEEFRSGCSTPQSPGTGRRIQWNPSPSPPVNRRAVFGTSQSPVRRKDIQWPPPSPTGMNHDKENFIRGSPRLSRKARFEDYIKEHASINVPQTYRPPPGTQHVEYR